MNKTEMQKFYLVILGWGEGSGLGGVRQVSPWAWSLALLKSMVTGHGFHSNTQKEAGRSPWGWRQLCLHRGSSRPVRFCLKRRKSHYNNKTEKNMVLSLGSVRGRLPETRNQQERDMEAWPGYRGQKRMIQCVLATKRVSVKVDWHNLLELHINSIGFIVWDIENHQ